MAPSIKALLLSSKVASCFLLSPKRKAASPSALGQGYSSTGTISTLTSTSENDLGLISNYCHNLDFLAIFKRSHLVKHMCSYMLYTPLSPSQLSHLLTSQGLFSPHGFQQLRLLKGRPDTQGSVEKNRNQAPFPTVTQGYLFLFRLVGLQTSQVCTHLGEKCLRSEACRSETSAHTGWMSKEPSHDWR